ncbi:MAG: hypothetical protein Q3985_07810 [Eubacteriales bacterium]|nr:hypothetical protein [Eubacteriales bacterium]
MAKSYVNHYKNNEDPYARQERAKQKAKGNPNKNVHQKKKNSNYQGAVMAKMLADKLDKKEKVDLPLWLKITIGVMLVAVLTVLTLRLAVYKDSLPLSYLSSLLLGATCAVLFYTRRFFHKKKDSRLYGVITIVLAVMAVIYIFSGAMGLLHLAGLF